MMQKNLGAMGFTPLNVFAKIKKNIDFKIMSPENSRKLWKIIQEAGDYLGG